MTSAFSENGNRRWQLNYRRVFLGRIYKKINKKKPAKCRIHLWHSNKIFVHFFWLVWEPLVEVNAFPKKYKKAKNNPAAVCDIYYPWNTQQPSWKCILNGQFKGGNSLSTLFNDQQSPFPRWVLLPSTWAHCKATAAPQRTRPDNEPTVGLAVTWLSSCHCFIQDLMAVLMSGKFTVRSVTS